MNLGQVFTVSATNVRRAGFFILPFANNSQKHLEVWKRYRIFAAETIKKKIHYGNIKGLHNKIG